MYRDFVKISVNSLLKRRVRSWLTMIGIFIGVALFVALISLGQGLQNAINDQFDMMGNDKIYAAPSSSMMGSSIKFTDKDLEVFNSASEIKRSAGWNFNVGRIEYKENLLYGYLLGMPTDEGMELIQEFGNFDVEEGRWIRAGDKYKANIGWDFAHVPNIIGPKTLAIGDKLLIGGEEFEIVGVVSRVGNPSDDRQIYIPQDTYSLIYDTKDEYDVIVAQVKDDAIPADVAEELKRNLRREKGEKEGEESFTLQTSENFRESFNDIFNIVNYFVAGLAFISLLVGSVGIMNTMYTAVLERTKEIGIMKAIGARNSDILKLFLIEAALIGMVGGAIGILSGFSVSKFVEYVIKVGFGLELLSVRFNLPLMATVFLFSIGFGAVAGALPARQASMQKPVDALRYE